jgi:hypothetical protein
MGLSVDAPRALHAPIAWTNRAEGRRTGSAPAPALLPRAAKVNCRW